MNHTSHIVITEKPHMLVATMLAQITEYFHHCRKFHSTVLFKKEMSIRNQHNVQKMLH